MIAKERAAAEHADNGRLGAAGATAEAQMAHYLRREFGQEPGLLVLHDLRLPNPGQAGDFAQIDHLLVHRYGLIVVESKSVHDSVVVNEQGEWWRTYRGQRKGMPSPVLQAGRQADVLRRVLAAGPDPLGNPGLARVPIAVLVAVSDQGVIERRTDVPEVCKADAVPDRVRGVVAACRGGPKLFQAADRRRLADHLIRLHTPLGRSAARPAQAAVPPPQPAAVPRRPTCRHCRSGALHAQYGPHSYYFRCLTCTGNTSIAKRCAACGSADVRIRKDGLNFYTDCHACHRATLIYTNATLADLDGPDDLRPG